MLEVITRQRTGGRAWLAIAIALTGCGSDKLGPVSGFNGADCIKQKKSCDEGLRLDAGGRPSMADDHPDAAADPERPDIGVSAIDAGSSEMPDATAMMDSGAIDSSVAPDAGAPPSEFLNLAGTWHTRYSFDLSHYLFGISGIASGLDTINQALMGHINTGFPPLDALIASVIAQFIPPWVGTLVNALDTIANLFSDVRANGGLLTIAQDLPATPSAPTTAIHATETWTELVIMIINQCPLGRSDPGYPTCAEHHIAVTHNPANVGPVTLLVTLPPFDGTLNAGVPQADFVFEQREVQMEMRKLILLIVNVVVNLVTPYPDLMSALNAVVDCNGLGQQAVQFAENNLGLPQLVAIGIGATVIHQCNDVINNLVGGVGSIGVNWEAMQFAQHGHAVDNSQPPDDRPEILQQFNVQDTIDGHFRFAIQSHMGGHWEGIP